MYQIRFNKKGFIHPYYFTQIKRNRLGDIVEIDISIFSKWTSKKLTTAKEKLEVIQHFYKENNKSSIADLFEIEEI